MSDKFEPTVVADVLLWDYTVFPPGHFDVIWSSPPCTEYSCAKTVGVRDLVAADAIVTKMLEIIDYFKPHVLVDGKPCHRTLAQAAVCTAFAEALQG